MFKAEFTNGGLHCVLNLIHHGNNIFILSMLMLVSIRFLKGLIILLVTRNRRIISRWTKNDLRFFAVKRSLSLFTHICKVFLIINII